MAKSTEQRLAELTALVQNGTKVSEADILNVFTDEYILAVGADNLIKRFNASALISSNEQPLYPNVVSGNLAGVKVDNTPTYAAPTVNGKYYPQTAGTYRFTGADDIEVTEADRTNQTVVIYKVGNLYTKDVQPLGFEAEQSVSVVELGNTSPVQSGAVFTAIQEKVDYLVNKPVSQYYNYSFFVDQEYNNSGNLVAFAGLSTTEMSQVEVPTEGLTVALVGITGGGGTQLEVYDENLTLISNISFASFTKILEEINTYKYTLTNTNIKFFTLRANNANIPDYDVFGILEFPIIKTRLQIVDSENILNYKQDNANGFTLGNDLLNRTKTNLAIPLPDGFNFFGTPSGSVQSGQTNTALEKIPTSALKQYAVTEVRDGETVGQYFNSSGAQVGLILPDDFFFVPGGQGLIIENDPDIAFFSLFYNQADTDLSSVRVYEADNALEPVLKDDLIPEIAGTTDGTALSFYDRGAVLKPDVSALAPAYGVLGQSNQSGVIDLAELPAFWTNNGNTLTDVQIQNANSELWHDYDSTDYRPIPGAATLYWSYEILLLKYIIDNQKAADAANKIYCVKYAVPGTPINPLAGTKAWTAETEKIATGKEALILTFEDRIRLAKASANGSLYNMKAFFMHQGESDSNAPQLYYKQLKYLIYYLRGVTGNPKLVFVLGGINTFSTDYRKQIEDAKQQIASEDSFVFYAAVTNDPAFLKADGLHFNVLGGQDLTDSITTIMDANKDLFGLF